MSCYLLPFCVPIFFSTSCLQLQGILMRMKMKTSQQYDMVRCIGGKRKKRQVNDLCVHEYQRRSLLRFCNKILVYFASNKEKTKNWLQYISPTICNNMQVISISVFCYICIFSWYTTIPPSYHIILIIIFTSPYKFFFRFSVTVVLL